MVEVGWPGTGGPAAGCEELERIMSEDAVDSGFERLLEYRDTVFLICLGYVRNPWDAEDLAQETYLRAHERLSELREPAQARAWISRIARNACVDHLRRARVRRLFGMQTKPSEPTAPPPDMALDDEVRINELRTALASLPARMREVLILREYGELSYEEIGRAMGLRTGTVMSRLHRARSALAAILRGGQA